MKDPIPRGSEAKNTYQKLLDEITSRELDARNLDTYADEALEDLVALVQKALENQDATDDGLNGIEGEKRALEGVGLDPLTVESTLDHISDVANSTRRLDALVMRKTKVVDSVIVPPDPSKKTEITAGDGSFEKPKEMIPKLKTLLLLLEKGLDIDINDDEEVKITAGALRPNMMRGASYHSVEVSSLNRVVLVCDEVGNTTYVFDTQVCDKYGITTDYLGEQNKPELNDLAESDENLGRRIDYSKQYVDHLANALSQPIDEFNGDRKTAVEILKLRNVIDHMPEGYVTIHELCEQIGITRKSVDTRIRKIGAEKIGVILKYRYPGKVGNPVRVFSPAQQEILDYDKSYQFGASLREEMTEGYVAGKDIAAELGLTMEGLSLRINKLDPDDFGERGYFDRSLVLSPRQQVLLREQYENVLNVLPEGFATIQEYADKVGVKVSSLRIRLGAIGSEFGKVFRCREAGKSKNPSIILSPEQQTILDEYYADTFSELPSGYTDYDTMASDTGLTRANLNYRIARFDPKEFGVIKKLLAKGKPKNILSPEQQAFIRADDERRKRSIARGTLKSAEANS